MNEVTVSTTDLVYDGGRPLPFINGSGLSDTVIQESATMREVASKLSNWVNNARAVSGRSSMFERGAYTPPRNAYDEMRSAQYAVENDDIVGGVHEITESFAFEGLKWESADPDDADAFNQLAEEMKLDELVRKMWLDLYTNSQFICTKVWGWCDYCCDTDTEILTKRGWLRYDQVKSGDETLGVEWVDGRFVSRWTPVDAVNVFPARPRTMVALNGRSHDSLTTPDHRWLTKPYPHAGRAEWSTSRELAASTRRSVLPLTAERIDVPVVAKYDDDFVELVAWYFTEGHLIPGEKLGISQSVTANPQHVERIEALLERLLGPGDCDLGKGHRGAGRWSWTTAKRPGAANNYRVLDSELCQRVFEVVDFYEKAVSSEFLACLTREQLQLFVDVAVWADGCEWSGRRSFVQASERRARCFEMACALLGQPTCTIVQAGKYRVQLLVQRDVCTETMSKTEVETNGKVWCPTTGTGTWLARRNGTVFFTGNTVRGQTAKGNKRKKNYHFWAPKIIRTQNPLKIVPVGLGPLAGDLLAWQATPGEINTYEAAYRGDRVDPLMLSFFDGKYDPDAYEQHQLVQLGVIPSRLLLMNPEFTFRHTFTKPDYERFPRVRLKSVFHLLDLKQQLISADRATLIGAATYILLIRKGSKEQPAKPEEMANLRENYNFLAKLPVIISDHRLEIDIIAPKTDFVLVAERYDVIDSRIRARLLGTLTSGRSGSRGGENETMVSSAVARVMQNHRKMLGLTVQQEVAEAIVNHPKNAGVFDTKPNLVYTPRNIALAMDPSYATGLLALRTQREISRETILEYWGLDEATEAMRMEMEAEFYDDIFKTEIPYSKGLPAEDVDTNLDKKDAPASGAPSNADAANNAPAKAAPAKKAAPAGRTKDGPNTGGAATRPASGQPSTGRRKTTPNGTPEAPSVSGRRGGRPQGGGTSPKSPAATAKPRTPRGNPRTRAEENDD